MWQAEYRLYLYPVDINKNINPEKLALTLQNIEFIAEPLGDELSGNESCRYEVGEEFLSLICFMGCSPNIEMEPQENSPFCYVETPKYSGAMRFIAGDNVKKVNCPHCKKGQANLAASLLQCEEGALFSQQCTVCKEFIDPTTLNWRRSAFIAKNWVLLGNIYESEAVPDEKLLSALGQESGCEWKYAYVRMK